MYFLKVGKVIQLLLWMWMWSSTCVYNHDDNEYSMSRTISFDTNLLLSITGVWLLS